MRRTAPSPSLSPSRLRSTFFTARHQNGHSSTFSIRSQTRSIGASKCQSVTSEKCVIAIANLPFSGYSHGMIDLPAAAKLYRRPVQLVDTPVGRDGEVARLAGGLSWFAAYELIAVKDGTRVAQATVPVSELPDDLRELAGRIAAPRAPLTLGERVLRMDQPQGMGILNVTPDSFSDAEKYYSDPEGAGQAGVAMSGDGAALIDVGGESTRPGADALWEGDEIARVVPVIERLARAGTAVSIDTRKAPGMEAALQAGAHLVNDVAALLWDPRALDVVARAGCPVVLMHSPDPAKGPHGGSGYRDVLIEVYDWLEARVAAVAA